MDRSIACFRLQTPYGGNSPKSTLFESLNDSALVATHARECIRHFEQVSKSLEKAEPHIKQKIPRGRIDDEFGRFKIWCGNVGAHRNGKGSLDYKLREASNIRGQVIKLLKSMNLSLKEADEILTGARIPWEDLSDSESDTSEDLDKPNTTELGQNVFSLLEINTCLMRLSMAIRNPAPHDQFKESAHFKVSHFEHFDKEHVRAKFPDAEEYLLIRLGKAISRRRQYLSYREEHRQKLGQGLEPAAQPIAVESLIVDGPNPEIMDAPLHRAESVTDLSERVASTIASSLPSAFKAGISMAELIDEADYEETLSETSYASSGPESARLRPPRIPKSGEGGDPFECPLCFRITSAQHERAWHKHVYRDLQPYVCTRHDCKLLVLIVVRCVPRKTAKRLIAYTNQDTNGFITSCRSIESGGNVLTVVVSPSSRRMSSAHIFCSITQISPTNSGSTIS